MYKVLLILFLFPILFGPLIEQNKLFQDIIIVQHMVIAIGKIKPEKQIDPNENNQPTSAPVALQIVCKLLLGA